MQVIYKNPFMKKYTGIIQISEDRTDFCGYLLFATRNSGFKVPGGFAIHHPRKTGHPSLQVCQ